MRSAFDWRWAPLRGHYAAVPDRGGGDLQPGGVLGIACAALVKGALSGLAPQVTMIFTWPPLLLACGFSALIGVGFGFFPARTAARLQPVEALARE